MERRTAGMKSSKLDSVLALGEKVGGCERKTIEMTRGGGESGGVVETCAGRSRIDAHEHERETRIMTTTVKNVVEGKGKRRG